MFRFFSGVFSFYVTVLWIIAGLIHLWTVYIAYEIGGVFWGFVSLFFPVISQLYWGFLAWRIDGFNSLYIQCLVSFVAMYVFQFVFAYIMVTIEDKINNKLNY